MTKLGAFAAADTERVSGKVTQVHVHPQNPRLIALEVSHLFRRRRRLRQLHPSFFSSSFPPLNARRMQIGGTSDIEIMN